MPLAPETDEFPAPEAAFTTLNAPTSGVSTTVAQIAKPDANKLSRAMPRVFIDEHPFADGLVGSVEFVVNNDYGTNVSHMLC